jgi:hypothetical protein
MDERGTGASEAASMGELTDDEWKARKPGCLCQWEEGDSPCPVHGESEAALKADVLRREATDD